MGVDEDIRAGHRCDHCDKIFSVASNRYFVQKLLHFLHSHQTSRNRHMKRMHEGKIQDKSVTCSLCPFTCRDRWIFWYFAKITTTSLFQFPTTSAPPVAHLKSTFPLCKVQQFLQPTGRPETARVHLQRSTPLVPHLRCHVQVQGGSRLAQRVGSHLWEAGQWEGEGCGQDRPGNRGRRWSGLSAPSG